MPFFSSNNTPSTTTTPTAKTTNVDAKAKANKEAEANTLTTSLSITDVGVTKAIREFEHGRQRAKKNERTANYRAEKAYNEQLKAVRQAVETAPSRQEKKASSGIRVLHTSPVKRADVDLESSEESEEDYWHEAPITRRKVDEKVEIDLTTIMQPAKVRKSKAGDFELVPSVRSVLALDDKFSVEEPMELDEPWECIDADDEGPGPRRKKTPTYADVLR